MAIDVGKTGVELSEVRNFFLAEKITAILFQTSEKVQGERGKKEKRGLLTNQGGLGDAGESAQKRNQSDKFSSLVISSYVPELRCMLNEK